MTVPGILFYPTAHYCASAFAAVNAAAVADGTSLHVASFPLLYRRYLTPLFLAFLAHRSLPGVMRDLSICLRRGVKSIHH